MQPRRHLSQPQLDNVTQVLLVQPVKNNQFVDAVDKLWTVRLLDNVEHFLLDKLWRLAVNGRPVLSQNVRTEIARHYDHGVPKVNVAALIVRQVALVQHLQEQICNVTVCLLKFVEHDHRVRLAT